MKKNHTLFSYNPEDFAPFYDFRPMYPKECRAEAFAKETPLVLYTKEYMDGLRAVTKYRGRYRSNKALGRRRAPRTI